MIHLHPAAANLSPVTGLPKMLVIRNYFGVPSPASGPALIIQAGDIIELLCADIHSPWWQVRDIESVLLLTLPCPVNNVRPLPSPQINHLFFM